MIDIYHKASFVKEIGELIRNIPDEMLIQPACQRLLTKTIRNLETLRA